MFGGPHEAPLLVLTIIPLVPTAATSATLSSATATTGVLLSVDHSTPSHRHRPYALPMSPNAYAPLGSSANLETGPTTQSKIYDGSIHDRPRSLERNTPRFVSAKRSLPCA